MSHRGLNDLKPNHQRGFNLIELMIALAIGGVLIGLAIPSFSTYVSNTRLTASANDLLATIQYARTEAIKRNQQVVLCRTTNALLDNTTPTDSACANVANDATLWNEAWLLYVTTDDRSVDAMYSSADHELLQVGTLDSLVDIRGNVGSSALTFSPDGSLHREETNVVFSFCDDRDEDKGRVMTIAAPGRPQIREAVLAKVNGNDYDCDPTDDT